MSDPYLGTRTLMRDFLDAVRPPGWNPVPGGDMDHQLDAVGDDLQAIYDWLTALGNLRDPNLTPYLDDLEREYGVSPNSLLTDTQRRQTLRTVKYNRNSPGTISILQDALNAAGLGVGGYGLIVYANDPAVDPGTFTNRGSQTQSGGANAYSGYNIGGIVQAFSGITGGVWVVNGDAFTQAPSYMSQSGGTNVYSGYSAPAGSVSPAESGYYVKIAYTPLYITSPTDAGTWPLCFFIATGVTRDGGGHITGLTMGSVPSALWQTLIEIILRIKPIHTWCALMVNQS